MNEIKVSVIIPVYNVEKYIKKSLESVMNQTLKEIEIICVNDGTKDNSRKIIEEYAQKDERIKIIDKENGGLSSARNAGMEIARGEYLGFVDSDDWIEETMYEKLYEKAKADESQMVICAVHKYDDKSKKIVDDDRY
jgi:glycosyltransferase involved in cell wall biosynthesis